MPLLSQTEDGVPFAPSNADAQELLPIFDASRISSRADLEQLKAEGVFHRRNDDPGHFMLRVRLTSCELSADQGKEVAAVAYEFGHGIVDVTRRADLQIQGVGAEHIGKAVARLQDVGLSCKQTGRFSIRNIFGVPYSGLLPHELIDTRPLSQALTTALLAEPRYSRLPDKFNIAFSGLPQHSAHYWMQDLSFLAARTPDGGVYFQVLVGGHQGERPRLGQFLPVFLEPRHVVPATQVLLDLFHSQQSDPTAPRVRFGQVVSRLGVGEIAARLEERLQAPLLPSLAYPTPTLSYEDWVGWIPQRQDGRWIMGFAAPVGRLTWQQLEGISVASKRWGSGQLRTTPEQGIAVVDIPTGFKDAVATEIGRFGLSVHADSLTRNIFACTGNQFCNLGVVETKGNTLKLIEKLRERALVLHGIRIHVSGCSSGCLQHTTADIGLKGVRVRRIFGTREGFDVYLGGGVSGQVHLGLPYKLGVDAAQVPTLIDEVVREYYLKHKPGFTFSGYWRERLSEQSADRVSESDYVLPIWACDSCQYRHEGDDPPVFCPKCAALRRHFARLEMTADARLAPPVIVDGQPVELVQIRPLGSASSQEPTAAGSTASGPVRNAVDSLVSLFREYSVHPADPNSTGPRRRGRPKDPKVAARDALIRRLCRDNPNSSHADIAQMVGDHFDEEVSCHVVRNALKRRRRSN